MARLVPGSDEGCGGVCSSNVPVAEEEEGGCGSAAGRTVGNDMANMEKQLAQNDTAVDQNLETEITSKTLNGAKSHSRHDSAAVPLPTAKKGKKGVTPRKNTKQVMGQCKICGYLSSQAVCKACVLLEGLNKARPKNAIQVGYEAPDLQQRDQGADGVASALQRTSIGGD
jgi:cytoplasmic tRNA 2-thiolation protein 1